MYLIVGTGYLGSYLLKHLSKSTDKKILATLRNPSKTSETENVSYIKFDVTDNADISALFEKTKNEKLTVFYFAACHNIDYIFSHPEQAESVNITSLHNFLNTMTNIEKLFFASTDCVYGENGNILLTEDSPTLPVNIYGHQKLRAEKLVTEKGFCAVRIPFMLGASLSEKPHFYDNILTKLKNGEEIEMIDGMYRSAISYGDAAKLLFRLSELEEVPSVVNLCGDKAYSKYDLGHILAKKHGADANLVKKISEKEGEKFFKDKRASSCVMDNSLLKKLLNINEIRWEEDICS